MDPRSLKLDWEKIKESQRERAMREVKASLLLDRIAEREAIEVTRDEVDREVERIARQQREPVAAVRMRLEKDGTLGPHRRPHPDGEDAQLPVRARAQDGGSVMAA